MISKPSCFFCFLIIAFLSGFMPASSQEKNWTHFRGSNLNGMAVNENIPLKWDDSVIKWKTEIHDIGYSSPVVWKSVV